MKATNAVGFYPVTAAGVGLIESKSASAALPASNRNLLPVAVCDRHTKNPLTHENSRGVVAEGTMAKIREERFRLIKPLVNSEIVLGLAAELLGAALRVLQWMRHSYSS